SSSSAISPVPIRCSTSSAASSTRSPRCSDGQRGCAHATCSTASRSRSSATAASHRSRFTIVSSPAKRPERAIPFFFRRCAFAMRKIALAAVLGAALLCAAAAYAYDAAPVTNGGTVTGVVKFDGVAPKPARLEIGKDKDVCGVHPLYDQSLEVGHGGGIANAVVTIQDIARGEPFKPADGIVFDQKGCQYTPHVIAFPAGSTVKVLNSDG